MWKAVTRNFSKDTLRRVRPFFGAICCFGGCCCSSASLFLLSAATCCRCLCTNEDMLISWTASFSANLLSLPLQIYSWPRKQVRLSGEINRLNCLCLSLSLLYTRRSRPPPAVHSNYIPNRNAGAFQIGFRFRKHLQVDIRLYYTRNCWPTESECSITEKIFSNLGSPSIEMHKLSSRLNTVHHALLIQLISGFSCYLITAAGVHSLVSLYAVAVLATRASTE